MQELVTECRVPAPNIGIHISKLERAGLVASVKDTLYRRCTLAKDVKVTKDTIEFTHASGARVALTL